MAARSNAGPITFGILNILVAFLPPCAGLVGSTFFFTDPKLPIKNREVGPEFKAHLDREVPHGKSEAIGAAVCNSFVSLLLAVGAIGLMLTHSWGRWLSIGAAVLMILTFCVHDIYQMAVFRPAVMNFLDGQLPPGPEREGFKFGFTASFFLWSCVNPLVMIYLVGMSIFLMTTSAFDAQEPRRSKGRGRRDDDDFDDDDDDDY